MGPIPESLMTSAVFAAMDVVIFLAHFECLAIEINVAMLRNTESHTRIYKAFTICLVVGFIDMAKTTDREPAS